MVSGKPVFVGITGNSGCGQSTAASIAKGFANGVCSLDAVGHRLLGKHFVLVELQKVFGRGDLGLMPQNELRRTLGEMVFRDRFLMARLNLVMHPRMAGWARGAARRLSGIGSVWILEGALIFELGLEDLFDHIIVIRDSLARCARRLADRDGLTPELTALRWNNQLSMEEKAARADYLADNSGGLDYLRRQIVSIFTEISENAQRMIRNRET